MLKSTDVLNKLHKFNISQNLKLTRTETRVTLYKVMIIPSLFCGLKIRLYVRARLQDIPRMITKETKITAGPAYYKYIRSDKTESFKLVEAAPLRMDH